MGLLITAFLNPLGSPSGFFIGRSGLGLIPSMIHFSVSHD